MKHLMIATAATFAFAAPSVADGHLDVAALLAMSNNSAAEIMLGETSSGDISRAQMRFALGNMSAAERETFFKADQKTQQQILAAQVKLMNGDSAAERVSN
ncbi:MAG: hypothetical protein AAGA08_15195 [Pseudomonadota bacterium]